MLLKSLTPLTLMAVAISPIANSSMTSESTVIPLLENSCRKKEQRTRNNRLKTEPSIGRTNNNRET